VLAHLRPPASYQEPHRALVPLTVSCSCVYDYRSCMVGPMSSPTSVVPATSELLNECLEFDHVAVGGSAQRRRELSTAADEARMRVATVDGRAVGFSVAAPWFFDAPFLALLYVDPSVRKCKVGSRLLEDFEQAHPSRALTSTNLSNAPMQGLLRSRIWTPCGILNGLDEGDPEIFFMKAN
jgi:GNAT superfamily N-acetyltransferase